MGGADPLARGGAAWGRGPSSGGLARQVGRGPQLDPTEDGGSGANEAGFGGGEVDLAATAHGWFSGPVDRLDRPVHMLFPFSFFLFYLLWRATGPPR